VAKLSFDLGIDSITRERPDPSLISRALYESARDTLHRWGTHRTHRDLKLGPQDLETTFDPCLPERRKTPSVRPADANCVRPKSERLEDVGPAAKTTVDQYRNFPPDDLNHFGKGLDG
jgi:hypothetical protein